MPSALDVQLRRGRVRSLSDPVRDPVGVPRPGVRRVVGKQVRVISQLDTDRRELLESPDSASRPGTAYPVTGRERRRAG
jgi:hypothetical protein